MRTFSDKKLRVQISPVCYNTVRLCPLGSLQQTFQLEIWALLTTGHATPNGWYLPSLTYPFKNRRKANKSNYKKRNWYQLIKHMSVSRKGVYISDAIMMSSTTIWIQYLSSTS